MSGKPKILLVDDDRAFVEANALLLGEAGYEVFTASDARSGLAAAREHTPDVAVVEVILGSPDAGFALARAIARDPGLQDTQVLIVTAAGERYGMCFEPDDQWLPVCKVVEKPTSGNELVREVDGVLARRGNAGERT